MTYMMWCPLQINSDENETKLTRGHTEGTVTVILLPSAWLDFAKDITPPVLIFYPKAEDTCMAQMPGMVIILYLVDWENLSYLTIRKCCQKKVHTKGSQVV